MGKHTTDKNPKGKKKSGKNLKRWYNKMYVNETDKYPENWKRAEEMRALAEDLTNQSNSKFIDDCMLSIMAQAQVGRLCVCVDIPNSIPKVNIERAIKVLINLGYTAKTLEQNLLRIDW